MLSQHSSRPPLPVQILSALSWFLGFYLFMNNTVKASLSQTSFWLVLVSQKVVTALDKTWHPEHFFCAQCGSFFGAEGTVSN